MRIAFVGSRNWSDKNKIKKAIEKKKAIAEKNGQNLVIISGGATGADALSIEIAKELKIDTEKYNPNWEKWGKDHPIEVKNMLIQGHADMLVAFRKKSSENIGTDAAIETAGKLGIPVYICSD